MSGLDRRTFLTATAGAAAYFAGRASTARAADSAPPAPPEVQLAGTDIKMSRVGQGTGMHGGPPERPHADGL
jgi:1-deoxyxylulose-5-phosphate synthase